ncbi:TonB-dependent receptor plug domain-containing protein [Hymenobacter norwichensis]|uniref:TonB-dependent receptor plug domain-containing protein n=1 Tax=Hymenobacter norwichensis TaxID=223903 RepID=UPI000524EAF1|nr:TonB-dependent receptor plug domain-containing protein [Hymenobacter norwichensis]
MGKNRRRIYCNPEIITTSFVWPTFTTIQPVLSRIAGVQVTPYSGAPGAWNTVRIRGVANVTDSSQPLYVVDGVPVYNYDATPESWNGNAYFPNDGQFNASLATPFSPAPNPLLDMPLENIASIEVVKGAAATAQYGGQGTNGIIRISTRRGADGNAPAQPLRVRYAGWAGVQQVRQRYNLLNARQYADLINVAAANNSYPAPPYSATDLANLGEEDWQDKALRVASMQSHNLSVDGLTAHHTRYYVAADYLRQSGVLLKSDLSRYSVRTNLEQQFGSKLTVGLRVSGSQSNQHQPGYEPDAGPLLRQVLVAPPAVPARNADGITFPVDPLREANVAGRTPRTRRLLAQLHATYQLTPALTLRAFSGYERAATDDLYRSDYTTTFNGTRPPSTRRYQQTDSATVDVKNWVAGAELRYQRTVAERHAFTASFTYWRQQYALEQRRTTEERVTDPNIDPRFNVGSSLSTSYYWKQIESVPIQSPVAALTYVYGGRYELQASLRSDFTLKKEALKSQYFWFPGAAVRWHLHQEAFLRDVPGLSALTVQAGLGYTNSSLFNPYLKRPYVYIFDPTNMANIQRKDLAPDRTIHLDAGVHLGLFRGQLTLDATVYERRTTHAQAAVRTGGSSAFVPPLDVDLRNRGLELALSSTWLAGPLRGSSTLAAATNRNQLTALRTLDGKGYTHPTLEAGQPIDRLWVAGQDGTYPAGDPQAGSARLSARSPQGNGLPRYTLTISQQLEWKKWSLTAQLDGLFGYQLLNPTLVSLDAPLGINNASTRALTYWTPTNQNTPVPRPGRTASSAYYTATSQNLASGNHLRLSQLQVSYEMLSTSTGSRKASVWVGGQNLLVTGKYRGYDPNVSSGGAAPMYAGRDASVYPVARVWQVGVRGQF